MFPAMILATAFYLSQTPAIPPPSASPSAGHCDYAGCSCGESCNKKCRCCLNSAQAVESFSSEPEPIKNGVRAVVDIPAGQHIRNTGGMGIRGPGSGAGLCVFTSCEVSGDWQNIPALRGFQTWMTRKPGGGWPEKLDEMLRTYCSSKGVAVPDYVQHTGGDEDFLDLAIKTGRCPAVTYSGRDGFYRSSVAHMVNLAHLDAQTAAIIDNNRPGVWVWMTRKEFLTRWREMGGGWAVVFLNPPPPPYLAPPSTRISKLWGGPLVGADSGAEPPEGTNFGVDAAKIHSAARYSLNGHDCSREEALVAVGAALTDDTEKPTLAVVGPESFLKRVQADWDRVPAETRAKVHLQLYSESDWEVSQFRLKKGLNLRKPRKGRLGDAAGEIGLDEYDLAKLLELLASLFAPVPPPAPNPDPAPPGPTPPQPNPTPTPSPSPTPSPTPAPSQNPLWVLLATILLWIFAPDQLSKKEAR